MDLDAIDKQDNSSRIEINSDRDGDEIERSRGNIKQNTLNYLLVNYMLLKMPQASMYFRERPLK